MLENYSLRKRLAKEKESVCIHSIGPQLLHNGFILMECQNAIVFISTPKRIKTISQSAYLDRMETALDEGEEGSNLLIPCR